MPESQDGLFFGIMGGSLAIMFVSVIELPIQYAIVGLIAGVAFMFLGLFGSEAAVKVASSGYDVLKPIQQPDNKVRNIFLIKGAANSYPVGWWDDVRKKVVNYGTVKDDKGKDGKRELIPVEWEHELHCKPWKHKRWGKVSIFYARGVQPWSDAFDQDAFQPGRVTYNGVSCNHNNVAFFYWAELAISKAGPYAVRSPVYQILFAPCEYIEWDEKYKERAQERMYRRIKEMETTAERRKGKVDSNNGTGQPATPTIPSA